MRRQRRGSGEDSSSRKAGKEPMKGEEGDGKTKEREAKDGKTVGT
jgi:hypothetical protein